MIIGFYISSYTDKSETIAFIKNHVLMLPDSIEEALKLKNFTFYGKGFDYVDFSSAYFTAVTVSVSDPCYINISGLSLEVPYDKDGSNNFLYRRLEVSDYFVLTSPPIEVEEQINILVNQKYLRYEALDGDNSIIQNDGYAIIQNDGSPIVWK